MIRHLPEPSIDRSDVRDAPDFEGLTREAYTHLLEDNRRLIAEVKALKRDRESMVNRVGQVFVNGDRERVRIVGHDETVARFPWIGVNQETKSDGRYSATGRSICERLSWLHLLGPSPPLSQREFDRISQNADRFSSGDDLACAVREFSEMNVVAIARQDAAYLAIDLPQRVTVGLDVRGIVDVEAVRIDAPDGEGFLYEIREKSFS